MAPPSRPDPFPGTFYVEFPCYGELLRFKNATVTTSYNFLPHAIPLSEIRNNISKFYSNRSARIICYETLLRTHRLCNIAIIYLHPLAKTQIKILPKNQKKLIDIKDYHGPDFELATFRIYEAPLVLYEATGIAHQLDFISNDYHYDIYKMDKLNLLESGVDLLIYSRPNCKGKIVRIKTKSEGKTKIKFRVRSIRIVLETENVQFLDIAQLITGKGKRPAPTPPARRGRPA